MLAPLDVIEVAVLVRKLGCEIWEMQYNSQAFGSWYITLKAAKGFARMVWDGKEGTLIFQTPVDRDRSEWLDIWIGHDAAEQTLDNLLRRLPG